MKKSMSMKIETAINIVKTNTMQELSQLSAAGTFPATDYIQLVVNEQLYTINEPLFINTIPLVTNNLIAELNATKIVQTSLLKFCIQHSIKSALRETSYPRPTLMSLIKMLLCKSSPLLASTLCIPAVITHIVGIYST